MAAYPDFTPQDLADFSGRPVEDYSGYADSAISQAELLFKLGTCTQEWPDDPTLASLAEMAIMAMADAIYLSQPYQAILANPFSSESIGSYSYSKVSGAVLSGIPTGVTWFDVAVNKLGQCDIVAGIPIGGGIEAFEWDAQFTDGNHDGNTRILSPDDFNTHQRWLIHDPSVGF